MKRVLLFCSLMVVLYSCRKQAATDPAYLPDSYSDQALGASAHDLLSADKFTAVNIQVQYMPGYQLEQGAIDNVTSYLNTLCNKPDGIHFTQAQIAPNGDTLNVQQVAVLERQNRSAYNSGKTLALYIIVTDGYDTTANVLGFAYRNTSICLFGKDIFTNSGGLAQISRVNLETSVLEHELGHIMGLVNLGSPMVTAHEDDTHTHHCTNTKCLMYYAIETHNIFGMGNSSIPVLDDNCLADLHANGGK